MASAGHSPCFIIAEIGVNHDGSLARALDLIEVAKRTGADAVKFQSFSAREIASESAALAPYQAANVVADGQVAMLAGLELEEEQFVALKAKCDELSIEFMSTAFDEEWLAFLLELGIRRIKWPSGELTNLSFLALAAAAELPILLSTGMAELREVESAVNVIENAWSSKGTGRTLANDVTILQCTSLYPAPLKTLNLTAIRTLAEHFGTAVGFSDHSEAAVAAPVAIGLGATVIEKHLTYDRSAVGPDHRASLDEAGFTEYVRAIRLAEHTLGSGEKVPHDLELATAAAARKSIFVAVDLQKGGAIRIEDLAFRRPGSGIGADRVPEVVGKVLRRDVAAGSMLAWSDIAE